MISSELSDRLALSRERIRQALQGARPPRGGEGSGVRPGENALPWLASLKSLPFASVVIDAVMGWWAQHPLRVAVVVASAAANVLVQPLAQRNPLGLVLGSAVVGGLVMWSRPWRWLLKPALFAGLAPQLLRSALARVPAQLSAQVPAGPPQTN